MGFLNGTVSFVRFAVVGELPENPLEYIGRRISAYSFRDIDESTEEYSIGWVSVANMFDSSFSYASYHVGDYVVLTLRVDERKVPAAVIKKMVAKEEMRICKERQLPKLGRAARSEIKESVVRTLAAKTVPVPAVYDVCWSLSDAMVLFFTTNKKAHALLEDFFKDCFGLLLSQHIPYTLAERLLKDDSLEKLPLVKPQLFI